MIKIVLIDDHALVREGLRLMLRDLKDIQIIGQAGTGAEGVQLVRELQPSVVILDLKLPDITGIEVTTRLLRLSPAPKILVVTSAFHNEFPLRILEAGALGYVTKDIGRDELVNAIKSVNRNQPFISSAIASRLALAKIDHQTNAIFASLTNKEMEVLILSVRGVKASDIAKRLHMSPKTVHSYRSHIFEKLGVENDVGLTLLVVRENLMTIDEAGN
ncbi:MAG: response regulator [Proteobacteria bacterium]|nr:response regulator [Pseudomonadota bacterium]